jgi:diguanylate cyclase (GGDEF)-like protein
MNGQTEAYTVISIFLSGTLALLAILLWQRRSTPGNRALAYLIAVISLWTLAAGLEFKAPFPGAGTFWATVGYLCLAACAVLLVQFAVDFTQKQGWLDLKRRAALWGISCLVSLLALTNPFHSMIWLPGGAHGAGSWIAALYIYLVYAGVFVILVRTALPYPRIFRRQLYFILVCLLFPAFGLASAFAYSGGGAGLFLVPQSFAIACGGLAWGLQRLRLFDLQPVARERIIEWMDDPIIVLDNNNRILDLNPAVRTVLLAANAADPKDGSAAHQSSTELVGRSIDEVFGNWPELISRLHLGSEGVISPPISAGKAQNRASRSFDLRVLALVDQGGRKTGKIVILHDITTLYMAQEEATRMHNLVDAIRAIGPTILSSSDLNQTMNVVLEQISHVVEFDCASFYLPEGTDLVASTVRGFRHPEMLVGTRRSTQEEWPGEQVTKLFQPAIFENLQEHPNLLLKAFAGHIQSCLAVPVTFQNHLTGLLILYSGKLQHFAPEDSSIVQMFTSQVAFLLENSRLTRQMEEMAVIDPLTGLNNRKNFFALAENEFARSRRYGRAFTVFILDIDHFKQINEIYGHHTGDLVLTEISQVCANAIRKVDIIGRYGGEEFAVILPETGPDVGLAVARRLHHRLTDQMITTQEGTSLQVSISIGVAAPVYPADTLETIMDRADQALHTAKRSGGNQVRAYEHLPISQKPAE